MYIDALTYLHTRIYVADHVAISYMQSHLSVIVAAGSPLQYAASVRDYALHVFLQPLSQDRSCNYIERRHGRIKHVTTVKLRGITANIY